MLLRPPTSLAFRPVICLTSCTLCTFVIFHTKQHVPILEAATFVTECFNLERSSGLEGLHTRSMYDRCLIAIHRPPVNLGFGIRFHDREKHRVPVTIIDNRLGW